MPLTLNEAMIDLCPRWKLTNCFYLQVAEIFFTSSILSVLVLRIDENSTKIQGMYAEDLAYVCIKIDEKVGSIQAERIFLHPPKPNA